MREEIITVGTNHRLTLEDVNKLLRSHAIVRIDPESFGNMERTFQYLRSFLDKRLPVYGINTQFGDQVHLLESLNKEGDLYAESMNDRQNNLINSHSCGLGNLVSADIVRVAMMLRTQCLSQGYSAVSKEVVQTLVNFLNAGIAPCVRQYGSIGASGDLIPLAMIAAGLKGADVDVMYQGQILKAPQAIELASLQPLKPQMRDGLALVNGTSFMTAIASVALLKLKRLFKLMMHTIGMSLESMLVITSAYSPIVHQLKGQLGEIHVNNSLLEFWTGSQLLTDLDELRMSGEKPVQDYYSLRAVAQGFGPFYENLQRAIDWVENEMNSVNDNPIIDLEDNKIHHNASFMGYYVTDACDILKMNIAQASTWLHALLANMLHPRKNHKLPTNLVVDPESQNGFRPLQLLACSIAVQNRKLAQSQQSFMLPTEGDNQDVNSLGTHAAFDLREAVDNLERLTTILLLAATQALEFRGIEKAGIQSRRIYTLVREHSPTLSNCRPMSDEIAKLIDILQDDF